MNRPPRESRDPANRAAAERGTAATAVAARVGTSSAISDVQRHRDAAAVAKTMLDTTGKRHTPTTRQQTDELLRGRRGEGLGEYRINRQERRQGPTSRSSL
jgi:hypothetical protein